MSNHWLPRSIDRKTKSSAARARQTAKLLAIRNACFEALEGRTLLSVATDTWTGAGSDSHWSTANNWDNGTPASGEHVVFDNTGSNFSPDVDGAKSVDSLDVSSGYDITDGGSGSIAVSSGVHDTGDNTIEVPITLGANQTFDVSGGTLTLTSTIDDGGDGFGLTKSGGGTMVLSSTANATYSGATAVTGGTLQVDGALTGGANVSAGATLGGTGIIVGDVASTGGIVSPGDGAPGTLTTNALTLDSSSTLSMTLDGNTSGNGSGHFSRINAFGAVNLGGSTLDVTLGGSYTPAAGDTLTLISNASGSPVTGTFNGLAEGDLLTFGGGATFRITYHGGGSNHDVVLSFVRDTTATLASNHQSSVFGQSVTVTATVAPSDNGGGTPTGNAVFKEGSTTLATVALDGSGQATYSSSAFSVGTHNITVSYVGDSGFKASDSSTLVQTVSAASTSTAVTSSTSGSSVAGQSVIFTATVSATAPGSGTPTGSITFKDGATVIGTGTLSSGQATLTTSALSVATHTITAVYSSDANYNASTSSGLTQTVAKADTSGSVSSSNGSTVFGQSVTYTATFTSTAPGTGTPTGSVTFKDGSTTIGSSSLNGSGHASLTIASLTLGSHTITVVYAGDTNYNGSTSSSATQNISQASTHGVVTSSNLNTTYGQSVTFTALVTASGSSSGTPTGTVTFLDGGNSIGTGSLDGSGRATLAISSLIAGNHTITISYAGDTNYAGSTASLAGTQRVAKSSTTVSLGSNHATSVFGQSVTITATMAATAPGSGTPTGTVSFYDGGVLLQTAALSSGATTYTSSSLTVAGHTITATYNADSNFNASTSSNFTQTVNKADTSNSVASNHATAVYSQSVTLTATITATAPGAGTPAGTVTFFDGATSLGTSTLDGSGQATYTSSALTTASHSITAVYNGSGSFNGSTSNTLTQTENQDTSTTTLLADVSSSTYGQTVTFTATVAGDAPGTATPTGTVTFKNGSTTVGTASLDINGVAVLELATLPVGSPSITAHYNADTNFSTSTSSAASQTVAASDTTTVVTSSDEPGVVGEDLAFTVTVAPVAPGAGMPTGTVTISADGSQFDTASLDGDGQAVFHLSSLDVGSHAISAAYAGDANYNSSDDTGTELTQDVNADDTTIGLASNHAPAVWGQSVTITATVAAATPGSGVPTGNVVFKDGGSTVATVALNGSGQATYTSSALTVGDHTITAVYAGDSNYNTVTSSDFTQTINKSSTTSSIASTTAVVHGETATITATVAASGGGAGTATGTVTFMEGSTTLGTHSLTAGSAAFTISSLLVGTHTITAVYGGDTHFNGSTSSTQDQVVNKAATGVTLGVDNATSSSGESVTFTADVAATAPGTGTPTGTITFKEGSSILATVNLTAGEATYTTHALSVASHTITAVYSADGEFLTSTSSGQSEVVSKDNSATALDADLTSTVFGQTITYTATVTASAPGSGTPTGTVTFTDGATPIGTVSVDENGVASFEYGTLSVGSHTITATYNGDANFNTGTDTSSPTVAKADTTTALDSSDNPGVWGESVTFTATVSATAPGAGTPTGTVTFKDGSTTLGTGNLNGSGVATFTTSALALGSHSITAIYGTSARYNTSTSSAVSQTIDTDDATVTIGSSAQTAVSGQNVTLTATVAAAAPGSGTPTGTVEFFDGSTSLGVVALTSGSATYSSSSLDLGDHTITAVYSGDTDFNTQTSADFTQHVGPTTTTTVLTLTNTSVVWGQTITFNVDVVASGAGAGTPSGSIAFKDGSTTLATITLNGSAHATYSPASLTVGSHTITAVYLSSDSNFITSTSANHTQLVSRDSTTTTLTVDSSRVFGESVMLTANVTADAPGSGTPTGTILFYDGSTQLGSAAPDNSGNASIELASLSVGNHLIQAIYAGETHYLASVATEDTQVVAKEDATVTLGASDTSPVVGETVTFTATVAPVAPGVAAPTGTITFLDGATPLQTVALTSGVATYNTSALALGSHSITAQYNGSAITNTHTSSATAETVGQASTGTALSALVAPSVFGQSVTFTATVTTSAPGSGTPTGTVEFFDGATSLGVVNLTAGQAQLAKSDSTVASHSITAVYSGDANYVTSTSSAATQVVNKANSSVTLGTSAGTTVWHQSITFTATVSAAAPGAGSPSGTITFFDGLTSLATVNVVSGQAQFTTSVLTVAAHSITAAYNGDGSFNTVTSSVTTQTINKSDTSVAASATPGSATVGQTVTLAADVSVTTPGAGTPTGTVSFKDGSTVLQTVAIDGSGHAQVTISSLAAGSHSITAVYNGDSHFNTSISSSTTESESQATTTTALATSGTTTVYGQDITLTATISVTAPGVGPATGTVTFKEGSTSLGTITLSGGVAVLHLSSLSVGDHVITATYNGNANFNTSSSSSVTQHVTQDSSNIDMADSNQSVVGEQFTFTAAVGANGPSTGIPTGTVDFYDDVNLLGTATVDSDGNVSFPHTFTDPGDHVITAIYSGDDNFTATTLAGADQFVAKAATSVVLTPSASTPVLGQQITLSAVVSVTAPGAAAPTGTVTFLNSDAVLGTVDLNDAGHASLNVTLSGSGDHSITARYNGDGNLTSSTSSVSTVHVTAPGTLAFSSATYSAHEADGAATLTVVRTGGSEGAASVHYAVTGGSAVSGTNFMLSAGTVSFENGETSKTISVTLLDDGKYSLGSNVVVTLSNAGGGASIGTISATTLSITESDARPSISSAAASVAEGNSGTTPLVFTVHLSAAAAAPVSFSYATADITAIAGVDYTAGTGTITFDPGQTSKTITVQVNGDTTPEANETFSLIFSNPSNATLALPAYTGTITNDDDFPPTIGNAAVTFTPGANVNLTPMTTAADGDGDPLTLSILNQPLYGTVTVNNNGTLSNPNDDFLVYHPGLGDVTTDTFTYQVSDGHGATAVGTATVAPTGAALVTDPFNSHLTDLVVVGTGGNDNIRIATGKKGIAVTMNGVLLGNFKPTGRIVANGLAGDDVINATGVTNALWIYGGDGNDVLTGGASNDILIGGAGADTLDGNAGKNVLIGGTGADTLKGHGKTDLLVAGSSAYDTPSMSNQNAVATVLNNFVSKKTKQARSKAVSAGTGGNTSPHFSSSTIFDDGSDDILIGNASSWIFGRDNTDGGSDKFYQGRKLIDGAHRHKAIITEI